jgi:iron complex outermembrane receptor protein
MKYNRNPLSRAIQNTLGAGAVISMALASGVAFAQDEADEEGVELDRVQVTGSRIKRVDIEGSTPVTVISREDIDFSGDSTVAELLRSSTFNSFGSFRDQSGFGNGFSGASFVSLRGLGSQRTLVLMDGRRLSAFPGGGSDSVDLNMIPIDMIERIEILRDGASAIYGSDAIAGVINIITRKDLDGAILTIQAENPEEKGGEGQRYSVAGGISSDRGNVTFSIEHFERDMIFDRDVEFTANAVAPTVDNISSYGFPGSIQILSGPSAGANYPDPRCPSNVGESDQFPNSYKWDFGGFVAGSTGDGGSGSDRARCGYNFAADTILIPRVERNSGLIHARFDVTPTTQFVSRALFAMNESESRFAGAPVTAPFPIYGADNPNNPVYALINAGIDGLSEDDVGDALLFMRTVPNGTREGHQSFYEAAMYAGFVGTADLFGGMDWDIGFEYVRNNTKAETRNLANKIEIQNAIDDGSLDYFNVQDLPFEEWRDNTFSTLQAFNHTGTFQANTSVIIVDGSVSWDLFQMNNGPVPLVIGFQYYDMTFDQLNDPESNRLIIAGTSGGDNIDGVGRDVSSIYAETVIPIFSSLELNLAVRYDDYSDFGGTTNPKASIAWRPIDSLLLRASYGTGFRAPNMQELYGNVSESFPPAVDLVGCANGVAPCSSTQYRAFFGGNPDLDAEKSDSWTLGAVWNATDDLSFELSYYNIQFEDQISTLSLQRMFQLEQDGFANTVNRNPDGTVNFVQLTQLNLSGVETDGIDFSAQYGLNTDNAGLFNFKFELSYVLNWDQELVPGDGFFSILDAHGVPEYRANFTANWTLGNFQVGWVSNYIPANGAADATCYPSFGDAPCTGDEFLIKNDSWLTHDLQVAYNLPWNAEIAIGARNIFDEDPPLNGPWYGWAPFDKYLYDGQGRITYLRYKQNF